MECTNIVHICTKLYTAIVFRVFYPQFQKRIPRIKTDPGYSLRMEMVYENVFPAEEQKYDIPKTG